MTIPEERLAQISHRFAELEARLASGTLAADEFVAASRDYAELEPVAKAASEVREMRAEIAELAALGDDPEMKALADEELAELRRKLPEAEHRLAVAMLPRDSADARPAMLGAKLLLQHPRQRRARHRAQRRFRVAQHSVAHPRDILACALDHPAAVA